jgi:hypothetical protein
MADNGVDCSMSRSGNVRDNAAAERFFSSLRIGRKVYPTRDAARADVSTTSRESATRSAGPRPLDEPFERQAILQLPGDDLTEPIKEIGGRLAVDARQIRRAPSRHPLQQKTPPIDPASFPSHDNHLSAFSKPRSVTDLGQPLNFWLAQEAECDGTYLMLVGVAAPD